MLTIEQLREALRGFKTCYILEKTDLNRSQVDNVKNGKTKNPHYSTGLALHKFIENQKGATND